MSDNKPIADALSYEPKLTDFGFTEEQTPVHDERSSYKFLGGEDKALRRLNEYIFEKKSVAHYAKTRN